MNYRTFGLAATFTGALLAAGCNQQTKESRGGIERTTITFGEEYTYNGEKYTADSYGVLERVTDAKGKEYQICIGPDKFSCMLFYRDNWERGLHDQKTLFVHDFDEFTKSF